jgi:hypothetical protein
MLRTSVVEVSIPMRYMEIEFVQRLSYLKIAFALLALGALNACSSGSDTEEAQNISVIGQRAPTITGSPRATAPANAAYQFIPTASDADGDPLTFQIMNRPSWASFDAATGRLSGVPSMTTMGMTYTGIVISVSDGGRSTSLPAFSIQVSAPPNQAPTITGTPSTAVQAGRLYTFQPTGVDPEGSALTYSIENMPPWATFSQTTGRLTGTPASDNVGIFSRIVISVSDGVQSASLPAFAIQVTTVGNNAPAISGSPSASIPAGSIYSFTPAASDPDGSGLIFSIQNRPAWASFSTTTGALTGTPTPADAGLYQGIVISVSDGQATVSLPLFAIMVTQLGTGSATITWTAPTTNTDGSPLTDLNGYRVYYGLSVSALTNMVDVPVGILMHRFDNLNSGVYYFAVTARNSSSVESDRSDVVWKVIQ